MAGRTRRAIQLTFGVSPSYPALVDLFLSARFESSFVHCVCTHCFRFHSLIPVILLAVNTRVSNNFVMLITCKMWPSLHAIRPLDGSLCHCRERHIEQRRRGAMMMVAKQKPSVTLGHVANVTLSRHEGALFGFPRCSGSGCLWVSSFVLARYFVVDMACKMG